MRFYFIAVVLLASCTSFPGPPHPATAVLRVEPPRRGLGADVIPFTVIAAVDGRELADDSVPNGISLRPGWHRISLSARRRVGQMTGRYAMGRLGEAIGSAIDELQTATLERTLQFYAQPGRDYLVRRDETSYGPEFRIIDQGSGGIVSR